MGLSKKEWEKEVLRIEKILNKKSHRSELQRMQEDLMIKGSMIHRIEKETVAQKVDRLEKKIDILVKLLEKEDEIEIIKKLQE